MADLLREALANLRDEINAEGVGSEVWAAYVRIRDVILAEPPTNARGPGLVYVCQRTTDVVRGCGPDASQWCAECPQRSVGGAAS